jgi:hypothetical protein
LISAFAQIIKTIGPFVPLLAKGLVATLKALLPMVKPLAGAFVEVATALVKLVPSFVALLTQAIIPILPQLGKFLSQLIVAAGPLLKALVPVAQDLAKGFITLLNAVLPILPQLVSSFVPVLQTMASQLPTIVPLLAQLVVAFLKFATSGLATLLPSLMKFATVLLPPFTQLIKLVTPFAGVLLGMWATSKIVAWGSAIAKVGKTVLTPFLSLIGRIAGGQVTASGAPSASLFSKLGNITGGEFNAGGMSTGGIIAAGVMSLVAGFAAGSYLNHKLHLSDTISAWFEHPYLDKIKAGIKQEQTETQLEHKFFGKRMGTGAVTLKELTGFDSAMLKNLHMDLQKRNLVTGALIPLTPAQILNNQYVKSFIDSLSEYTKYQKKYGDISMGQLQGILSPSRGRQQFAGVLGGGAAGMSIGTQTNHITINAPPGADVNWYNKAIQKALGPGSKG